MFISGKFKNEFNDATKKASLTWSELKQEADIIISTLKEAGRLLYDPLPNGRNIPRLLLP